MKIKKNFCKIETSREPVKTSKYVRYLGLHHYEPGMQYDAHEYLLQLLATPYPNINDDCMFKIKQRKHFVMIVVTLQIMMMYVMTGGMLHQLMDPRGEYLENYRCVDRCQKLNTSTKAVYVTKLPDALIMQLSICKYIDGISKKFIPNLSNDEEISLWKQNGTFWCYLP